MSYFYAKRYFNYKLFSWHKYGHGIHSPFVYSLIREVFNDKQEYPQYRLVLDETKRLRSTKTTIQIYDFGSGSKVLNKTVRKIGSIAKVSSLNYKYGSLLYRLVSKCTPQTIIELGTCLGIGTSWLAQAAPLSHVFTIEGDDSLVAIAQQTCERQQLKNMQLITGNFNDNLPKLLATIDRLDFVFFDGNHAYQPTITYFELCLTKSHYKSVFVFDDIHWSLEMEKAWTFIKQHPKVMITIDLCRLGLVFFEQGLSKQDFTIRY